MSKFKQLRLAAAAFIAMAALSLALMGCGSDEPEVPEQPVVPVAPEQPETPELP